MGLAHYSDGGSDCSWFPGALGKAADALESLANMHNFSSPAVSMIAFTLWLAVAVLLSLLIMVVPASLMVFMGGLAILVSCWLHNAGLALGRDCMADTPVAESNPKSKPASLAASIRHVLQQVPKSPTISHRVFCAQQQLEGPAS